MWKLALESSILVVLVVLVVQSGILARTTAIPTGWACLKNFVQSPPKSVLGAVFDREAIVSAVSVIVFWTAEPNRREPSGCDSLQISTLQKPS